MNFKKSFVFLSLAILLYLSSCLYSEEVKRVTIAAVGDIMCHDSQLAAAYVAKTKEYNFKPMFTAITPFLQKADIVLGNLETTLPGKDYKGYPYFGSPDSLIEALKVAGFHVLTTANNHSMDRGSHGLRRTLDVLESYGLAYTGTYRSPYERQQKPFLLLEKNGIKIALLNYTYGTNGIAIPSTVFVNLLQEELIRSDIAQAHSQADFILVSYHFGNEYERLPSVEQKKFVSLAFFEGAHVVLGSHPHVIQPYLLTKTTDRYGKEEERFVIYSLGNFISGQTKPYTKGGLILYFTLEKYQHTKRISQIQYQQVFTVRPQQNVFSLEPLPQLFENPFFTQLSSSQQSEIRNYYKDIEQHLKLEP